MSCTQRRNICAKYWMNLTETVGFLSRIRGNNSMTLSQIQIIFATCTSTALFLSRIRGNNSMTLSQIQIIFATCTSTALKEH